jgi:GNAT superfamily N-acetyltransferase
MNNQNYNQFNKSKTALFGLFECRDSQQAADELFTAGKAWAKKQGLTAVIGPRGLTPGDGGGVLIEGFKEKSIMGIPYNYPYYDRLLRNYGFMKNTDYLSGYFNRNDTLDVRYRRVAYRLADRRGFIIKSFYSQRDLNLWINRILDAHRLAFSENHTYFPPSDDETSYLLQTLKKVVDHRLIKIVLKDDQIAGFLLCLPDLSDALRKSKGRLLPWGWYHLLREKKRSKQINVNLIAVMPRYRGLGVLAILYTSLADTFFRSGYDRIELVTVEEKNSKAMNENNYLGAHWYKRHRDYRLAI